MRFCVGGAHFEIALAHTPLGARVPGTMVLCRSLCFFAACFAQFWPSMPYYACAFYYACDGEPLRIADELCVCAERVYVGEARFDLQIAVDKWCRAWMRVFSILDWQGHAGWSWR